MNIDEPILISNIVLHTIIVTNMWAKLIDNKGSINMSFINLYFLSSTIIIDRRRAIIKLDIINLLEMIPGEDITPK